MHSQNDACGGSLAGAVADYLTFKRKRLTPSSQRAYSATLRELTRAFPDAPLAPGAVSSRLTWVGTSAVYRRPPPTRLAAAMNTLLTWAAVMVR